MRAFPSWCADAWTLHQYYRELGIPAEEIYLELKDTRRHGENSVAVVAKEGELFFAISVGSAECTREQALETWATFVTTMNEQSSDAEMRAVVRSSQVVKELDPVRLAVHLRQKGFVLKDLPGPIAELIGRIEAQAPPANSAPS